MEKVPATKREAKLCVVLAALLLLLGAPGVATADAVATSGSGRGSCTRSCGNISIEYPFGMEPGCYHVVGFNLTCDTRGPFFLSESESSLVLMGCDSQVLVRELGGDNTLVASCSAICLLSWPSQPGGRFLGISGKGACSSIGCCQINIVLGYSSYLIQIHGMDQLGMDLLADIYMVDQGFNYTTDTFYSNSTEYPPRALPALLKWVIITPTTTSRSGRGGCMRSCGNISIEYPFGVEPGCYHAVGFNLTCNHSYQLPRLFLDDGTVQVLNISIPDGTVRINSGRVNLEDNGLGSTNGTWGRWPPNWWAVLSVGVGEQTGVDGLQLLGRCLGAKRKLIGCLLQCHLPIIALTRTLLRNFQDKIKHSSNNFWWINCSYSGTCYSPSSTVKQRRVKKLKEKFFKQNHGLLLQQLISKNTNFGERMIITLEELQKATNNFDRSRQVGDGGHGVMFKGILDLNVVAIKKVKDYSSKRNRRIHK
uniref:Wall-associated receptor kinase galacturonan-binding domain-containing protein n=1 Tax=Oryza glumipatula TaxID=40148 RepID=A0A0D9ZWJ2_9ORYZ